MARGDKVIGTRPSKPRKTKKKNTSKVLGGKKDPKRSSGNKSSGNKTSSSKKSSGYSARAAERRAVARANAEKKEAGQKYLHQAGNLTAQADALRKALRTEFADTRKQNIRDIDQNLTQVITQLKEGFAARSQTFLTSADDAAKATAATQEGSFSNLVRERGDAMTGILEQGAGETDAMRAMVMAARNWHANAGEANRAYFDSMQSINTGIEDLNVDTKTGMQNAWMGAEGQKENAWQDYYNRRAEAFTQLGNTLGQKADYLASAKEMGVKVKKKRVKKVESNMEDAWMDAAKESGKSYKQKALPDWASDWEGLEQQERRQENTNLAAAVGFQQTKKAQGATLRKWAA